MTDTLIKKAKKKKYKLTPSSDIPMRTLKFKKGMKIQTLKFKGAKQL